VVQNHNCFCRVLGGGNWPSDANRLDKMSILFFDLLLVWVVCGFIAHGFTYAYFMKEYPDGPYKNKDRAFAIFMFFLGPFGLFVSFLCSGMGRKHGWMGADAWLCLIILFVLLIVVFIDDIKP